MIIKQKNNARLYFSLAAVLLLGAFSAPGFSATYYACDSGYTFQVQNNAARCFKAASWSYKSPLACGNVTVPVINRSIGHFLKKDHQGNADKCVGTFKVGPVTNSNVLDLACPAGYGLEVRAGADRCRKRIEAVAKAPNRKVNR